MATLVAELILGAKEAADKVNDSSIDDDPTWTRWVNFGVESLWKFLVVLDPLLFRQQSSPDFTLAGGFTASTIDLSTLTRFRALLGLEYAPDTTARRALRRRNFQDRDVSRGAWAPYFDGDSRNREYDVAGNTLTIYPPEASVGTYRVYFRQGPYVFTVAADTTALDPILEPHKEYIVLQAGRRARGREESVYDEIDQRLGELKQEITDSYERDGAGAESIADVLDDWRR